MKTVLLRRHSEGRSLRDFLFMGSVRRLQMRETRQLRSSVSPTTSVRNSAATTVRASKGRNLGGPVENLIKFDFACFKQQETERGVTQCVAIM